MSKVCTDNKHGILTAQSTQPGSDVASSGSDSESTTPGFGKFMLLAYHAHGNRAYNNYERKTS